MIPAAFDYQRATTIDDAVRSIGTDGVKVIAGGQSLLPLLKLRLARADKLVDIGRIKELRSMRELPDGGYEVGALTTYADIIATTGLDWVREATEQIGDVQVRNRGTVGGSIAHADPASDAPAISLALDYSAVLRSVRGERVVPLDGFFRGPFQTAMESDELLVAIRRPPLPTGARGAYRSLEQPASGYSMVGVVAISHARVAVTGVGDAPYRAKAVESALAGSDGSAAAIESAAAHATDGVTVASDIHADAEYRAAMARIYVARAVEAALAASA